MLKSTLLCSVIAISVLTMNLLSQESAGTPSSTLAANAVTEQPSTDDLGASTSTPQSATSFWDRQSITGEWGGIRNSLQASGIQFAGQYIGDAFVGGNQSSDYLFNIDFVVTFDLNEILGWTDASVEVYGLGNGGTKPSERRVVAQSISTIETTPDWRLYSAHLQFALADGDISVLVGLYDVNSEFCSLSATSPFINSALGMGSEFAQAGEAGPSTFPATSFGIRTSVSSFECWSVSLALLDGVPGDPNSATGTHVLLNERDGILAAAEIVYAEASEDVPVPLKAGIGVWTFTSPFDDNTEFASDGSPLHRTGNAGIYGIIEGPVARGLSGFFRIGTANAHMNRFDLSFAGGVNLHDVFNEGDIIGIAFSTVHNGQEYRAVSDPLTIASETVVELTYVANLTPWLAIQPDLQLFNNPNGDATRGIMTAGGARFLVSF